VRYHKHGKEQGGLTEVADPDPDPVASPFIGISCPAATNDKTPIPFLISLKTYML
jgi:hypothetical protein